MKRLFACILAPCILALGLPVAAAAQTADTLSEDEIAERFRRQQTRGLAIAPVSGGAEATDAAAEVAYVPPAEGDEVLVNITFDFDSAALRADQKPKLESLCGAMQSIDVELFRVVGHTDAAGSADYNERLSKLRAEEVKRYLVNDCGIAAERLEAVGVGEEFPLPDTDPRADANRRVEFLVLG